MSGVRVSLFVVLLAVVWPGGLYGQTIRVVDGDGHASAASCLDATPAFASINAAIAAAADGDTVLVCPGTYVENIDFAGKSITVRSTAGAAATIIDGGAIRSVITFATRETAGAVLDGFTVRNGRSGANGPGLDEGAGIRIQNASPTIRNNVIVANHGCDGIGISIRGGAPVIEANNISGNTRNGCSGGNGGGGLMVSGASNARIRGNAIRDNVVTSGNGGGISLNGASGIVIERNTIAGNRADGIIPCSEGGGIAIVNESNITITGNVIAKNTAGCGGGIYWLVPIAGGSPLVVNNTIDDNDAAAGSGIFADGFDAAAVVVNNIIVAAPGETSISCGALNDLNPPILARNDVYSPTGVAYGGICADATGVNGNMSADPMFADPFNGNYRIGVASPAVDAGDKTTAGISSTDLDGAARVVDGDGDGVPDVDLGAYEFQGAAGVGGTISGTVTAAGTATPLSGVTIQVYTPGGAFAKGRVTDGNGSFRVSGLAPGSYYLRTSNAGAQGFVDELYDNVTCVNCPVTIGTAVAVSAGAVRSGVDFALAAAGSISGMVTDPSSVGLSGVTVSVYTAGGLLAKSGVTLGGAFTVNGLAPGTYFARTFAPDDQNFVDELYNNVPCLACVVTTGTPITVVAGATRTGVDFSLEPGAVIAGFITDARTHSYVSGVGVAIYSSVGTLVKQVVAVPGYQAAGLPAGTYFARTFAPSSARYLNQLFDHIDCDPGCAVTTGTPIVLAPGGGRVDVNFSLVPLTRAVVAGGRLAFSLTSSTDVHWVSLEMVEGRSYCGEVASAATSLDRATPSIDAYAADGLTAIAEGSGSRVCFEAPATGTALFRIVQAEPGARAYRLSVVETTLWANWFFIAGDFSSYVLLRNTTNAPVHVTITARDAAGAVAGTAEGFILANGVAYLDAAPLRAVTSQGSIEVAHDGEPQALVGSQTTLSATAGLSFDTVMVQRGRR
jgi:hypothetical protein